MKMRVAAALVAVCVLAGCDLIEPEPSPTGSAYTLPGQYCIDKGGEVQDRQAMYGTNNDPSAWVELGWGSTVCKLAITGDDTAIFVDLTTLYAETPTLAALAYLESSAPADLEPSGNPAAAICSALGGASEFGPGVNGGGFTSATDTDFPVVSPCTFADGSFIDEWGIAYHQDGTIRGADLVPLFRFDVGTVPNIFT